MANPLGKLFGSTLGELFKSVTGLVDSLHTSEDEKLKAKLALAEIERQYQLKSFELDNAFADIQSRVVIAEAQSPSWAARNWRPILMLTFTFIVAWNFVIAPLFGLVKTDIPPDMWDLLKIGIGGYVFGRSLEKVAPDIVGAIAKGKKEKA